MKIEELFEEYKNNTLTDDDDMYNLKDIIFNKLTEVEKRLLLLYAELQSYAKLGKQLNISSTLAYYQVKEIKKKIKQLLEDEHTDNN